MNHKQAVAEQSEFTDLCKRCRHRSRCKAPCAPVEKYLAYGTSTPFEIYLRDSVTKLCPASKRVVRRSEMVTEYDNREKASNEAQRAFSTENDTPFQDLTPRLKQTGIFIDRFFNRMPYAEIAEKYATSEHNAQCLYQNAVKRLDKTVKAMDRIELAKANGKRLESLPTRERVRILYCGLEMSVTEIARFIGINHSAVIKHVRSIDASLST